MSSFWRSSYPRHIAPSRTVNDETSSSGGFGLDPADPVYHGTGTGTSNSGAGSVTMGAGATTAGGSATVVGANGSAAGTRAAAFGYSANAGGSASFALGAGATAGAGSTVSIGAPSASNSNQSVCLGPSSASSNTFGVSIGFSASVTNISEGIAVGANAVSADWSSFLGTGPLSIQGPASIVQGGDITGGRAIVPIKYLRIQLNGTNRVIALWPDQ